MKGVNNNTELGKGREEVVVLPGYGLVGDGKELIIIEYTEGIMLSRIYCLGYLGIEKTTCRQGEAALAQSEVRKGITNGNKHGKAWHCVGIEYNNITK